MRITRPELDKSHFKKLREHVFLNSDDTDCVTLDTRISRYMNIDSFINIMKRKYQVNPRAYFSDKCEQGDFGLMSHFPLTIYGDTLSEDQKERHKLKLQQRKLLREWHATCFTLSRQENYLFWRTYTHPRFGIMIESTIESFLDSIKRLPYVFDIYIGKMRYDLNAFADDKNHHAFKKSYPYKGENELRIYFIKNDPSEINIDEIDHLQPKPIFIDIDPEKLINQITPSPFMDKMFAKHFTDHLKEKYKSLKIKRSNINERL